jgi:MFS family permease
MWAGFLLSHVGDSVQLHAQAWLVSGMTRSGAGVGAVVVAQAVPRLVLGLFAGVAVDRFDRRKVLVVTQLLALAQTVVFLWLVRTGRITYTLVLVLAFALGVVDTLNLNARVTLMPTLVPKPLIARAIALQALGVNVVQISGPSLAGLIIGRWDTWGCLVANALTFAASLGALAFMRATPAAAPGPERSVSNALREGFSFVRGNPLLFGGIALAWLHGFFGVSVVRLYALFAREVLHVDGPRYGWLAACGGVGAILASVLVTTRARQASVPRNIAAAALFFGFTVLALSAATTYPLAIAAVMAVGAGQMAFRSAVSTAIQVVTPDRMRGRVMSLLTLDFSLWSFGALAIGAIGDGVSRAAHVTGSVGLRAAFSLAGVVCVLCALWLAPRVARSAIEPARG